MTVTVDRALSAGIPDASSCLIKVRSGMIFVRQGTVSPIDLALSIGFIDVLIFEHTELCQSLRNHLSLPFRAYNFISLENDHMEIYSHHILLRLSMDS